MIRFRLLLITWLMLPCHALLPLQYARQMTTSALVAEMSNHRRRLLTWLPTAAVLIGPRIVFAAEDTLLPRLDMKEFVDPVGIFYIQVPSSFYTLRRSAKGDLPDGKGQGRRGSSIFTAGNMAKAEVIAVER